MVKYTQNFAQNTKIIAKTAGELFDDSFSEESCE